MLLVLVLVLLLVLVLVLLLLLLFPTTLCGVLVFDSVSRCSSPPPPPAPPPTYNFVHLSHTTFPHTIFHPPLSHTTLSHTIFHATFPHTIFHTHNLSHTTLSHTNFHAQLCHTPFFTHNFPTHHLSHTSLTHNFVTHQLPHNFVTHTHTPSFTHNLSHTTLSHTNFHTQLCHTLSFTHNFPTHHLSHTSLTHNFVTHQLSHATLSHTIFHTQLCNTPSFTHNFAWQACHLWHTFVLRGRRGTYVTRWRAWSGFVACDAAAVVWQAWYLVTSTFISRGRRGTNSHPTSFCVAGMALMALGGALGPDLSPVTPRPFAWQTWYLVTSTFISHIHLRFAWQAWHLWHWVARLVRICRPWRRGCLRGRRGTWWHSPPFHVAGVAQTHIHRRFAWQAWRLLHTFVLRGRRGAYGIGWRAWSGFVACDAAALCVAGVVLGDIHIHFRWQAWHKLTSTVVLRGRRGAYCIPLFCVAGVPLTGLGGALGPDLSPVTPLPFVWQACYLVTSTFISRGR